MAKKASTKKAPSKPPVTNRKTNTAWEKENALLVPIYEKLSEPLPVEDLEFRVGARTRDKKKGQVLTYVTSRAVADRLDEGIGPGRWSSSFEILQSGDHVVAKVRLDLSFPGGRRAWHEDIGTGEGPEAYKGAVSDGLKRCCSRLGIGRYLYDLPNNWVELKNERYLPDGEEERQRKRIPQWARPGGSGHPHRNKRVDISIPEATHLSRSAAELEERLETPEEPEEQVNTKTGEVVKIREDIGPALTWDEVAELYGRGAKTKEMQEVFDIVSQRDGFYLHPVEGSLHRILSPKPTAAPATGNQAFLELPEAKQEEWLASLAFTIDLPAGKKPSVVKEDLDPVGEVVLGIPADAPRGHLRPFPGAATKQLPNPKPRWLASQFQGGGPHKGRFFAEAIADKGFRSTIHAAAGSPHTPVEHKPFYEQVASYAKAAQSYLETFYPGVFQ